MWTNDYRGRAALPGDDPRGDATQAERFCTTSWCQARQLRVLPGAEPETWSVVDAADGSAWQIAADAPICPRCGSPLSEHPEGTGDSPEAAPNPFVGFIQGLEIGALVRAPIERSTR